MLKEGLSAASSRWASACHRVATRLGRSLIIGFVALLGLLFASQALAAAGTYRIYIDSDASAATGCSASLIDRLGPASEAGFEHQITVVVDAAGNVNNATHAACTGTAFSGADPIGLTAPRIALVSRGANLLGQLELAVPVQAVGATPNSRIIIASDGDYINRLAPGSNAAITLNGAGIGVVPPAAGTHAIPTVTPGVLVALALLLAGLGVAAVRYLKPGHAAQWLMAFVLVGLSGSGIAAITLVIDGNTEDWAGLAPLATDMTGDQVTGTADLHSLTVSLQGDEVFFRIDTVEGANPNRDLSPLELDSTLPRFSTHPSLIASVGKPWVYKPGATDQSGQSVSLSMTQGPSGMQITGAAPSQQLAWTPAAAGVYWVTLQARDGAGLTQIQTFPIYVSDDRQLPADPTTRATPMSPTGFTPFAEHTAFLYQGADPIQTGVQSGAIDPVTATVIRGQVLDSNGQPLPGATVRIAGRPEYGQTRTRADGWYDLAANGGGWVTVQIDKPGYMSAQRRFQAPWRDWAVAPEVVLLPFDPQYTRITAGATQAQMYYGSTISDGRGDRRTSVYFPAGTQATAVLPDGRAQPLTQMNVRVSEYTVGSRGPLSMPAELNLAIGYTWAANFTVDEAEVLGAKSVKFSKPVVAHIDNFIDMPVGSAVPAGWYDFDKTAWVGDNNGRIVKLLSVDGQGHASLQVGTEERPATVAELQALGIDEDELKLLARTRTVGAKLWRVRMEHFTPWDCNWPWGPPPDSDPPPSDPPPDGPPPSDPPPPDTPPPPDDEPPPNDDGCPPGQSCPCMDGCDVLATEQAVGQEIDLPGTDFSLYYRSDRIKMGPRTQRVRATGATAPTQLNRIDVRQTVAGRVALQSIPRLAWAPNQSVSMSWDGRDAYGRLTNQGSTSTVQVSYVYPAVRYPVAADFNRAFERVLPRTAQANAYITADRVASNVAISKDYIQYLARVGLASADVNLANAGNWSLRGLRLYDPSTERMYESGGRIFDTRSAKLPAGFAAQAKVPDISTLTPGQSAIGPDGALYFAASQVHQIQRIWLYGDRKGRVDILAGTGDAGYSGDGGQATAARLSYPTALAIAPDGAVIFMDWGNRRLRRISPLGTIESIAGNGDSSGAPLSADGVPALDVNLAATSLAVSKDMTIWAVDSESLRQISTAGMMSQFSVSGEPVIQVVSSPDGIVWFNTRRAIYQFNESGDLRAMPDTGKASGLTPDRQGGVYFKNFGGQYSHVSRSGTVTTFGENYLGAVGYGAIIPLGTDAFGHLVGVKNKFDGSGAVVGTVGAGMPPFGEAVYRVAKSDGASIDEFDRLGRPVATRSTFGGELLASYQYDAGGQLMGVTDSHGNRTTFTRDAQGQITSVTGPFGQRTTLTYNGRQLAQVQQPGGLTHSMGYLSAQSDLLTSYRDPRGGEDRFSYNRNGNLRTNQDPAGGGWAISKTTGQSDYWSYFKRYNINAKSAEGRDTKYDISAGAYTSDRTVVTRAPDGSESTSRLFAYGHSSTQFANGSSSRSQPRPDPRLGSAASQGNDEIDHGNGMVSMVSAGRNFGNVDDPEAWRDPWGWRQTTLMHQRDSWTMNYFGSGEFGLSSPLGRSQNVRVNAHQLPQTAELPTGLKLQYGYNAAGQLTGISSTDGNSTRNASFTWSASGPAGGKPATRTNALGQTERFAYDGAGRLVTHTLIDGRTLRYGWDASGNLSSLTTPAGVTHSFNYNAVQRPTGYEAPQGASTQWTYDRDRKLTSVVRPGGQTLSFTRLPGGQVSGVTDSAGPSTSYTWRTDGRLASATTSDNQAIAYNYSGAQLSGLGMSMEGTSASLGFVYENAKNYWWGSNITTGRIGALQLTAGGSTQNVVQRYDADGLLITSGPLQLGRGRYSGLLDAIALNRVTTSQTHDAWGQLTSINTSGQGMVFGSAVTSHQLALSSLIRALGDRLSGNITQRGDCLVMTPAQERLCPRSAAVNSKAKPTAPRSTQRRALDARAQLKPPKPVASARGGKTKAGVKSDCVENTVITSAQEAADNSLPWPPRAPDWDAYDSCQQSLQYHLDTMLGGLENSPDPGRLEFQIGDLVRYFSQGPSGFIQEYLLPTVPGTFRTSYIDAESQKLIDQIKATIAAWKLAQPLWGTAFGQKYTRDALGRITRMQEVVLGQSDPDKTYQYDTAGRLTGVTVNGISTTWGYDANGNRTHENGQAIATYDSQDKLQSWRGTTYQYNAAGDLTQRRSAAGTSSYRYDSQGNLRQVTLEDGRRIDYAIDPDNRRVGKKINGQLQWQMVWQDSLRPIARLKADGSLEATYYYADSPNVPAAMSKGGKLYRIITDHLGSVRMVMDAETGEVAQQMSYDAWGQVVMDTNPGFQPFGFAGGIYDPDTKLTRFDARDYDAQTGRWTSKDPIIFAGGDYNLYGYVLQNPINGLDPEGLRNYANNAYGSPYGRAPVVPSTREIARNPGLSPPAPTPLSLVNRPSRPAEIINGFTEPAGNLINAITGQNRYPSIETSAEGLMMGPDSKPKPGQSCYMICSGGGGGNICKPNDGCRLWCGSILSPR